MIPNRASSTPMRRAHTVAASTTIDGLSSVGSTLTGDSYDNGTLSSGLSQSVGVQIAAGPSAATTTPMASQSTQTSSMPTYIPRFIHNQRQDSEMSFSDSAFSMRAPSAREPPMAVPLDASRESRAADDAGGEKDEDIDAKTMLAEALKVTEPIRLNDSPNAASFDSWLLQTEEKVVNHHPIPRKQQCGFEKRKTRNLSKI